MQFIRFTEKHTGAKHYFVGKNHQSILADTKNGTEFGPFEFDSHQIISREEAESLNLGYMDSGVRAVERGCLSFKLKTPQSP